VSFIDLPAVDYPVREKRFDVVPHRQSPKHNRRIRTKVATGKAAPVPSLTSLYPATDCYEREAYHLGGEKAKGNPQ
jgi:NADH-quinone oxidoreductase subunit C